MGILDEAIREHLELKRQHGAEEPELKKLEDEALGAPAGAELGEPPEMSDADAEAPTDYIGSPAAAPLDQEAETETEAESFEGDAADGLGAEPDDPTEDPRPPEMRPEEPPPVEEDPEEEVAREAAEEEETVSEPSVEEQPAMEHEVPEAASAAEPPEPPPVEAGGVSAELRAEREEIAQHPTEHYDVEGEIAEAEKEAAGFFNEQSLSDELDQALDSAEAPPPEEQVPAEPSDEVEVVEEAEEVEVVEETAEAELDEPGEVEAEPEVEEAEDVPEADAAEPEVAEADVEPANAEGESAPADEEDVLEETPEFLQDSPEEDRLWFEQKPPKDFDFDD